jgi:cell division protein FtsB
VSRLSGSSVVALAVAAFLASLSLVAWRQARALEELIVLDSLRQEVVLAHAERAALLQSIQHLEGRIRIAQIARERLGMIQPPDSDIVFLDPEEQ